MKIKNPLKRLTLSKVTIAHLSDGHMDAARGGSTGDTGHWTLKECPPVPPPTNTC